VLLLLRGEEDWFIRVRYVKKPSVRKQKVPQGHKEKSKPSNQVVQVENVLWVGGGTVSSASANYKGGDIKKEQKEIEDLGQTPEGSAGACNDVVPSFPSGAESGEVARNDVRVKKGLRVEHWIIRKGVKKTSFGELPRD